MRERAGAARGAGKTERSGEAKNVAQGSRVCGESGGVHGAQVAKPACGDGLSGEAGARGARRRWGRAHLTHLGACAALAQPPSALHHLTSICNALHDQRPLIYIYHNFNIILFT
ncbi:unnamed protein product [Parnassius apollo]|uniref:(apollo) hypothetical protein n=1 Tax=Parnassius apollo TaxID=110799 RepID=A0A8S3XS13_PARAO|nr:unnamed protein product [Parnassius apollo]